MPVLKHFKKYIEDNSVHALDLKCMTPEQSSEMGNTTFDPHSGKQEFFGIHVGDLTRSDIIERFNWTPSELQEIVDGNDLVIFMKGTPEQPQCGFSSRGAQIVSAFAKVGSNNSLAERSVRFRARTALKNGPISLQFHKSSFMVS